MSPYLTAEIWKRARVHRINIASRFVRDVPTNGKSQIRLQRKVFGLCPTASISRPSVAAESRARISLRFHPCRFSTRGTGMSRHPFSVHPSRSIDTFLRCFRRARFPECGNGRPRAAEVFLPRKVALLS